MAHPHIDQVSPIPTRDDRRALLFMLFLTAGFMVVEFIAGIFANSLALMSDAGHMLNDVFSLVLTYVALIIALRPPSKTYTFGFMRSEVITGFINGLSLLIIAGYIIFEAIQRAMNLGELQVNGSLVLFTAIVGLVVNIIGILLLHRDHFHSVNIQAAYSHIIADALGSIGALLAGVGILLFKAYWLDLVISLLVAVLVVRSGLDVTLKSLRILLEAVPEGADPEAIRQEIEMVDGILQICDFHLWKISKAHDMLTAHVVIDDSKDGTAIIAECKQIAQNHGFSHLTIQTEFIACNDGDTGLEL